MILPDIGTLFVIALGMSLVGGVFSLVSARFAWGNALTQIIFALAGCIGFAASMLFFYANVAGVSLPLPFNMHLAVRPLPAFFLGIVYFGTFLTSVFNIGSLPRYRPLYSLPWLNFTSGLFIFGMQATIMSSSIFSFLVFWEIMSVAAYFLVIADQSTESLAAGFLYFVMTQIGFACLLSGFLILADGSVFVSWADVVSNASTLSPQSLLAAFVLLFAGFGSKAGLVPLHQWLPYAHPQAPSGSSALLSGVMLKVALFGFIQSAALFPFIPLSWALGVIVIGLVSALFGVLHAAVESDAKRLLAWSSIENMGLLFSGVGLVFALHTLPPVPVVVALITTAILFVVLHTINHFLFKTGLFMATGAVVSQVHTRELDRMGGLAHKWPVFSGGYLALALAAAALPPSGTFFGEWAYFQTLAIGVRILPVAWAIAAVAILAILALVGGLAIFAFVKMFSAVFLGRARSDHAEHVSAVSAAEMIPPLLCVVASLLVGPIAFSRFASIVHGLDASLLVSTVTVVPGASMNAWFVGGLLVSVVALAVLFRSLAMCVNPARITDTWDCGQPLTRRMQYTSTGFAAPIRFFFRAFVLSQKQLVAVPISPQNPWISQKTLEWSVSSFWEQWLYRPVARSILHLSGYVRKLQSGVIQAYLAFILIALIAVLIFAL